MPQTGTGFVNLSNYLDANKDALGGEATGLINTDTNAAKQAMTADNHEVWGGGGVQDYAANKQASQNAYNNLQGLTDNTGSLQDQIHQQYGGGSGQNSFDAALLGNSQGARDAFGKAQGGYAGLDTYLDSQVSAADSQGPQNRFTQPPPAAAAPAQPAPAATGPGIPQIAPTPVANTPQQTGNQRGGQQGQGAPGTQLPGGGPPKTPSTGGLPGGGFLEDDKKKKSQGGL